MNFRENYFRTTAQGQRCLDGQVSDYTE